MEGIFDTHAHYDDESFDSDREELLSSLPENGIVAVTNIGADIATSRSTLELTRKYPFFYGAIGVHPTETGSLDEDGMRWLREHSGDPKVVAIGEIGLDYYWEEPERRRQKEWFARQLSLAREVKLPVVIHSRDAAKDTLDVLTGEKAGEIGGVIHCFSYSEEMARDFLNLGFYLGIGGVLTFQNAKKLKDVVRYMPIDRIVLETDCPYLSPAPNRGKRNSSLNLPLVAAAVGRLKEMPPERVIEITAKNAEALYRIAV